MRAKPSYASCLHMGPLTYRMEILSCHHLSLEHFKNIDDAFTAADKLVQALRAQFPGLSDKYPDLKFGIPQLDQFYYFNHQGALAALVLGPFKNEGVPHEH